MSGVVDLLHVDLGDKHQVAVVVMRSLQVEVMLLGFCLGIQVLHLAPRAAGWGQVDLIRHLRSESLHEGCLVLFKVEVPTSLITEDLNVHAHRFCNCRHPRTTAVDFPEQSLSGWLMELFRDIGVKLVLQRVESDIASLQHVTLERTKSILCCGLHIGDVIKELGLLVESAKVQEITTGAAISWDHEFKGGRKLPHVVVVLVEERDQVLTVSTHNCILPWGVIQLDHPTAAIQNQSQGFHDGASKQHRRLARQQIHLNVAMLAAKVKRKADSPGAVQTGITSEKEGSLASHELDLGDVVVGLLELEHVAQERAIARKKCTGSWVEHGTVMSFVASKICKDHMAVFGVVDSAFCRGCLPLRGSALWHRAIVGHVSNLPAT